LYVRDDSVPTVGNFRGTVPKGNKKGGKPPLGAKCVQMAVLLG